MTAITGSVKDVTGVEDNETPWSFASVIRFAEDGSVITEKPREVRAVSGNLKVNLVPGYAIVTYGKHVWQVTVPETPTTLKALIEAGVAFPPDTAQALLGAAVGEYILDHGGELAFDDVGPSGDMQRIEFRRAGEVIGTVPMPASAHTGPLAASYRPLRGVLAGITSSVASGQSPAATAINWWESFDNVRWCGVVPEGLASTPSLAINDNNSLGQVTGSAFQPLVIEFWSNATDIRITGYQIGRPDVWAIVDDQRIAEGFTHGDFADGYYTWTLTQGSAVWRKWRLCVSTSIYQITHNAGAVMVPTSPGFQLAVVGDSIVQGNISIANAVAPGTAGLITAGASFGELEQITGLDVWRCGVGGSGYVSESEYGVNGPYGSTQRVAKLDTLPAMDAIVVIGSVNDGAASAPTLVAAAESAWTAIKATNPAAPLIVVGLERTGGETNAGLDALNIALGDAARAHPGVHTFVDLRGDNHILSGTGADGSPAGDGNCDVFRASDFLHPTHLGCRYWGENLARILGNIPILANA